MSTMHPVTPVLCYIATPYTNFPGGIDQAFRQAAHIAAHLSLAGLKIFCPIAHGHALAKVSGLDPKNPAVFARLNEAMLDACGVLIVARMDGWLFSDGIREEIAFFERTIKPIYDLDPRTLGMVRRQTGQEPLMTDDRNDDRSALVTSESFYPFGKTRSEHGGGSA